MMTMSPLTTSSAVTGCQPYAESEGAALDVVTGMIVNMLSIIITESTILIVLFNIFFIAS